MSKIKAWRSAARLRTLPLSVSGIITGTALANLYGKNDLAILFLAILTTIGFHVTSNFANDYGDGVKGTDNEDRVGPSRMLQSGLLSRKELKSGIIISILINLGLIVALVYVAFGFKNIGLLLLFFGLGILSIWASINYTIGKSAYGYRGWGDFFVFIFFGLLAVMGSMFLYTKFLTLLALLPAIAIGTLSTAVLNLNNMRDYVSDQKASKKTIVVLIGPTNGKRYHYALLIGAFLCILSFVFLTGSHIYQYSPLVAFIPIFLHLKKVVGIERPEVFDPELKKLALSTFLLSILMLMSYNIFL
ncbi:MAG: 1,4-dihydroxy-2-naphthoate octaprenyltransferase [Flavobacteriales bacterium]|nr:MAG: 1,4-dihydroxy-2-naphthoate octaprenyltransferase [Flavobacteriales bacterium]